MDEFRLLGPIEAVVDGRPVQLAAAKPRALLALLLLNRNRVVPTERLIDELWSEEPPARATKALQVYVSQLRKELGPDRLVTQPPGYLLRVGEGELDLERFEQLTATARKRLADGDATGARDELREALDLWRGPPEGPAARLEDLRLSAREDWLQAALESGEAGGVIPELEELVRSQPLRERPRELLMLALYRSGRQADALELFRRTRELFVDELGIEPGPGLRELEQSMLRQDSELRLPAVPREQAAPAQSAQRRRPLWILVVVAAALVAAAITAALLVHDGGGSTQPPPTNAHPQLRSFVYTLENFLQQSREGLEQLAALQVPDDRAAQRAADLLQKAVHASISADWIYRDWLRSHTTSCVRGTRAPAKAERADARATTSKRRFVTAFNPLAKTFGRKIWRADEF